MYAHATSGRGEGFIPLLQEVNERLAKIELQITDENLKRLEEKNEQLFLMEKELLESQQKFRKAFEESAIGFAIVALDGSWLEVNQALAEVFQYSKHEMTQGMTFQEVTCEEDLQKDLDNVRGLLMGQLKSYQMVKGYIKKDTSKFDAILNVSLIRNSDGDPMYFVAQIIPLDELVELAGNLRSGE